MNSTKIIGIVLIAASLYVGYLGANKVSNNTAEVKVLGLEIEASDESGKKDGYIYLGVALAMFIGGIAVVNKK